jgi:hypothetical protein
MCPSAVEEFLLDLDLDPVRDLRGSSYYLCGLS